VLGIMRDDGAVAYLNGAEVYRANMPAGAFTSSTLATNDVNGFSERAFYEKAVDSSLLVPGTNILAVEIHQVNASSPDLSFDFTLTGLTTDQVRPVLNVAGVPGDTKLTWPPSAGFFAPYSATNLVAPIWTRVTNAMLLTNGEWRMPLPPTSGDRRFYRLGAP
jgi:hypothetical protein